MTTKPEFHTARDQSAPFNLPAHSVFSPSRYQHDHLGIDFSRHFDISENDELLVLGSCFARDSMHGMFQRAIGRINRQNREPLGTGLGHKYNAPSILQALQWARSHSFMPDLIVPLSDGEFFDGHLHPVRHYATRDEAIETQKAALESLQADLRKATVVVLTLDSIEVWVDRKCGTYLNTPPPVDLIAEFESRYYFERQSFEQTRECLIEIFNELHRANARLRIIAAVSPIPIYATFTGDDILVANSLCKCVLVAAMNAAVANGQNNGLLVEYCPTFELVTSQPDRATVWREKDLNGQPDGRHLDETFARRVLVPLVANQTSNSNDSR